MEWGGIYMKNKTDRSLAGSAMLQSMTIDGIRYELKYVRCKRDTCSVCYERPAHGPYWYARWNDYTIGRERRLYIGKTFMTVKEKIEKLEKKRDNYHQKEEEK